MMWQCINEERGEIDFMVMKSCVHGYLDKLCLACNLGNNNRWNYALRKGCFILVSNSFRWYVTLGNRVHKISTDNGTVKVICEDNWSRCHRRFLSCIRRQELEQSAPWSLGTRVPPPNPFPFLDAEKPWKAHHLNVNPATLSRVPIPVSLSLSSNVRALLRHVR